VPTFVRPKPVVERKHRFEVVERLTADGAVLVPLDPASVEQALTTRWPPAPRRSPSVCCTPT